MARTRIDPDSPIPLYHQIAELIRARILTGELAPGDALHPLRSAAERWGVHLHTVRHAYAALAREGFVEISRGTGGTRVAERAGSPLRLTSPARERAKSAELSRFLGRVAREAESQFGIDRRGLADALQNADEAAGARRPKVYVLECSEHQCAAHAREIADRYDVDARPWPLDRGEPPAAPIVATYFHYNDIRRLWPRRLDAVHFLTIRPSVGMRSRLRGRSGTILVCDFDPETAEAVIGDLHALLGSTRLKLAPCVERDPGAALASRRTRPVLFAPRAWARLDAKSRRDPRAIEIIYSFDAAELEAVASESGWRDRLSVAAS